MIGWVVRVVGKDKEGEGVWNITIEGGWWVVLFGVMVG
jgi:hypothetical protein